VRARRWRSILLLGTACLAACGDDDGGRSAAVTAPVLTVDRSRDVEQTTDFLRLIFLPANVEPTTLGAPSAVRVFVAASTYFVPPLALAEVEAFLGVPDVATQDVIGMRCEPAAGDVLDARLATWPDVFAIVRDDLGGQYTCPPPSGAPPENAVYCIALAYHDEEDRIVAQPLASALEFGAEVFADTASADVVRRRYGISTSFSGLGLTVKGSASAQPMTAADILKAAVSPEYLVRNASLGDAGCRCIRVAPYPNRSMDPFDPRFIREAGGPGTCRSVPKLRFARG
jgi:hypothetical protein